MPPPPSRNDEAQRTSFFTLLKKCRGFCSLPNQQEEDLRRLTARIVDPSFDQLLANDDILAERTTQELNALLVDYGLRLSEKGALREVRVGPANGTMTAFHACAFRGLGDLSRKLLGLDASVGELVTGVCGGPDKHVMYSVGGTRRNSSSWAGWVCLRKGGQCSYSMSTSYSMQYVPPTSWNVKVNELGGGAAVRCSNELWGREGAIASFVSTDNRHTVILSE